MLLRAGSLTASSDSRRQTSSVGISNDLDVIRHIESIIDRQRNAHTKNLEYRIVKIDTL